ncbi:UvrD-helicase domain-containing protein [Xiamenia xianingshaonis]|uniref:AAA family ATPase n=1 Tax=Xiamenia xianingshaonis TaxID=2682776 RepID=A0A9E6SU17_9ACTN|nr:UvrD-helicase domain-containing protein [Xiamenia xianingshaonis]NHM14958.1 AAA family ATPase [Xiamenia xianingshaonis]QTU84023.1 ATP-dependent helicase [Xiamenia xianingshaonis]
MTAPSPALKATRIVGAPGCGKTEHLVRRIADLLEAGVDPASVLAVCATPTAALAFARRLAATGAPHADAVAATTARALALRVLALPEAEAFTGRRARLLVAFEESFLMEDMKVSGLRPRRLHEMLKFFYRSWTEMADDDPAWLLAGEETEVHTLLKENLAYCQGMLEPEAANLAVRFLRTAPDAAPRYAHVLVDDYQDLSRASQLLAEAVATESITVAGCEGACVEVFDSYPYAKGLEEFLERFPEADARELDACCHSAAVRTALARLSSDDALAAAHMRTTGEAPAGTVEALACDDAPAEFSAVADRVVAALDAGATPESIVVATPNALWTRTLARALDERGVATAALPHTQPVKGDVRDFARSETARMVTLLNLVADPTDAVAWRCWCGFGDHLTNSAAFAAMRESSASAGITGDVAALARLAADPSPSKQAFVGAQRVAEAYDQAQTLVPQLAGLEGEALLDAIAAAVTGRDEAAPAVLRGLCLAADDVDAPSMAARARTRTLDPAIDARSAVALVPFDQAVGLSPDVLIVAGLVNGFVPVREYFDLAEMPLDKQERTHATNLRRMYALAGKAGRDLVLSYFTSADLETAGRLKLKIDRIRLKGGQRICAISRSIYADTLLEGWQMPPNQP